MCSLGITACPIRQPSGFRGLCSVRCKSLGARKSHGGQGKVPGMGRGGGRGGGRGNRREKRLKVPDGNNANAAHPSLLWYYEMMHTLIKRELDEEQAAVNERLTSWPLNRLLREGVALINMKARKRGRLFGEQIYQFYCEREAGYHRFMVGDIVTVSRNNPLRPDAEGVVHSRSHGTVSLVLKGLPGARDTVFRLDKGTNKLPYQRMRAALLCLSGIDCKAPSWLQPLLVPTALWIVNQNDWQSLPPKETVMMASRTTSIPDQERGTHSHQAVPLDAIVKEMQQVPQKWGLEMALRSLKRKTAHPDTGVPFLNDSQLAAVEKGLSGSISLIQGPPGTGKTSTAVHLIQAWRRLNPEAGPVLATAQSNVAVDQLLLGCVGLGLRVVRIGQPVRVAAELRGNSLDAIVQQHPDMPEVEEFRAQLNALQRDKHTFTGRDRGMAHRDMSILKKQIFRKMDEITGDVVARADVVCATCIGSGHDCLESLDFRMVVVDEATQCSEPEAIIPLIKCHRYGQIVLIGDHQQLPPTVISMDPESQRLLGTSLFQRIAAIKQAVTEDHQASGTGMSSALESITCMRRSQALAAGSFVSPLFDDVTTTMLQVQYRMHPTIAEWPSMSFYAGKLSAGTPKGLRIPPPGLPWALNMDFDHDPSFPLHNDLSKRSPLLFVKVMGSSEQVVGGSKSKVNQGEVQVVLQIIRQLLDGTSGSAMAGANPVDESGIGVVSPYLGQVNAIIDVLKKNQISLSFGEVEDDGPIRPGIEVKSVDGYQGREKEVIILSTVRSNPRGDVGFLSDYRRLNVAITRAKRGLVVVGNPETLRCDPLWRSWLDFLEHKLLIIDASQLLASRRF